jgi:polyisoprenoid-binding protein YceI
MTLLARFKFLPAGVLVLLAADGFAKDALAGNYAYDSKHADITFTYYVGPTSHTGHFSDLSGSLRLDDAAPERGASEAVIRIRTLTASMFEGELKSDTWFNIDKFPELRFKSRSFKPAGANKYEVAGDLTLHGVTQPVIMQTVKKGAHISAHMKIKRGDFGMTAMSFLVSEDIDIQIEADLIEKS